MVCTTGCTKLDQDVYSVVPNQNFWQTPEQIADTIGEALKFVPRHRLFPCTNCGLAPMDRAVAVKKLQALALGAALARERYGDNATAG